MSLKRGTRLARRTPREPSGLPLPDSASLLGALSHAQLLFIEDENPAAAFDELLGGLLRLTRSEYGFLGEVLRDPDGRRT